MRLLLGTAGLGGIWGGVAADEAEAALKRAYELGIRHLDTAPAYATAEARVGLALRDFPAGTITVSTKVGRLPSHTAAGSGHDYSARYLRASAEKSLRVLGVEVIGTLFLHEPSAVPEQQIGDVVETMCALRAAGLAQRLGLGGDLTSAWLPMLGAGPFEVLMGFNRCDAVSSEAVGREYHFARRAGMEVWQASPLHMGLLGRRLAEFVASPPEWLDRVKLTRAQRLNALAEAWGMALPELALRYLSGVDAVDRVVAGACTRREVEASVRWWRAGPLAPAQHRAVAAIATASGDVA